MNNLDRLVAANLQPIFHSFLSYVYDQNSYNETKLFGYLISSEKNGETIYIKSHPPMLRASSNKLIARSLKYGSKRISSSSTRTSFNLSITCFSQIQ